MDSIPQKQCLKCGCFFLATPEFFNRNKGYKDGFTSDCRTCRKAYSTQYNQEHRKEKNAKARAHYHANRERIQTTQIRPYHQAHKEAIRAYKKQWRQTNAEKRSLYDRQYYLEHKEDIIAQRIEYVRANREKHHVWTTRYRQTPRGREVGRMVRRNRRARLRNIPGRFTSQEFAAQIKRQQNKCYWCGKDLNNGIHADHIIPITRPGSSNFIHNIVASCPTCNVRRHNKLPHEWPEGGRLL